MKKLVGLILMLIVLNFATGIAYAVKIAFVGDVMLARGSGRNILKYGYQYPFAKVDFDNADIVMTNLEGTLTGNNVTGSRRHLIFRSPQNFVQVLKNGGIDIVSLANNHMYDGGRRGILDTIDILRITDIKYVGAGYNLLEAKSLRVYDIGGKKYGFLAYTDLMNFPRSQARAKAYSPGVNILEYPSFLNEVRAAKAKVDYLIVSFHWGTEGRLNEPTARQKRIAYACVDAGADIIYGHHPHVLEKIEVYHGKTIAYSLGNFVFDSYRAATTSTMIMWVDIDKFGRQKIITKKYRIKNSRPVPV